MRALAVSALLVGSFAAAAIPSASIAAGPHFAGGVDFSYNDNVLGLSESRIQLFESGASPQQFRIDSVDDFVTRLWLQGGVAFDETTVGARLSVDRYVDNAIKSNEVMNLYLQHRVGWRDALRGSYTWLRRGYAGELEDPANPGVIESKFYDVHRFDTRFRHRFSDQWSLTPRLAGQLLLYDGGIDDPRTLGGAELGTAAGFDASEWLALAADVELEWMRAPARLSNYDRSFWRLAIEAGPVLRFLDDRLVGSLKYRYARRAYTTNNSAALDPIHRDRVDPAHHFDARLEYSWRIASAYLAYGRDDYSADISGAGNLSEEETSFTRNLVTIGLGVRY